jgi:hypothetical protein
MKIMTKFLSLGFLVMLAISSGCMTWTAKIDDMRGVYNEPAVPGAPRIIITDLDDKRREKKLVGRISALNLATETPINVIITNRIAAKMREFGFNVQKLDPRSPADKSELISELTLDGSEIFLGGRLDHFYIESSDAILEKAQGRASYRIKAIDRTGKILFYKTYTGYAEKHIGLGGGPGSEELIEQTIQAALKQLFQDTELQRFMLEAKNI